MAAGSNLTPLAEGHVDQPFASRARKWPITNLAVDALCREYMILIDTLSEYSQNRRPYCIFSGLGDCPNKIILPFPSPEKMPTLIHGNIPPVDYS